MALIHHYSRDFSAATQGLDDSMAADDSMARRYEQTFSIRPEVSASARQLDDAIDACYNDEMLEKATMQIKR